MKLSAVLLLSLVAGALAAAAPKADVNFYNHREKRLFLGKVASLIGLGGEKTITVAKTPQVVYVQKVETSRACRTAYSADVSAGCPAGTWCTSTYTCVLRQPPGAACTTWHQCLDGVCRNRRCVKDLCQTAGEKSDCPQDQTCVSTDSGHVCRPKDDSCSPPLTAGGCSGSQYCGTDGRCTAKQPVDAVCAKSIQCADGLCRHHRCKADACPTLDSSLDCLPSEYCTSSRQGNVCKAKLEDRQECITNNECQSHRCENHWCVRHRCPVRYSSQHCPSQQFCLPGPNGNVCSAKLDKSVACSVAQACKSGVCTGGYCVEDQCHSPMMSDGCSMYQLCMKTRSGNTCMMKLNNNAHCTASMQCMSNNCVNYICRDQGGTSSTTMMTTAATAATTAPTPTTTTTTPSPPKPDGDPCTTNGGCTSGRCISEECAPMLKNNGEACTAASIAGNMECKSNNCEIVTPATTPATHTCSLGAGIAGAVCTDNLQCASGQCIGEFCTQG